MDTNETTWEIWGASVRKKRYKKSDKNCNTFYELPEMMSLIIQLRWNDFFFSVYGGVCALVTSNENFEKVS